MGWWRALMRYGASDDPLVGAGNLLAIVVGTNQPWYPVYVYLVVGWDAWPSWAGVLSAPFFLAVPAVARRRPVLGRALFIVTGVANVWLMAWAMGEAAGLELFLVPCASIAAMLFRRRERVVMLALVALPIVSYLLLRGGLGAPWHAYTAEQSAHLLALNAVSVGTFTGFIGIVFAGVLARFEAEAARVS